MGELPFYMKPNNILNPEGISSLSKCVYNPGIKIENQRDEVFKDLKKRFWDCLCATRPDSLFFLAPIDPGSGKTTMLAEFLGKWKTDGFPGGEGVLLCFSTKAEIEAFLKIAGLDDGDYSVQTSDQKLNGYGSGFDSADDAKVLLTTHQMIWLHAGSSFEKAQQFYYKGRPRALRVWDEALSIADPVSIRLDNVGELYGALRPQYGKLVGWLESSIPSSATANVGGDFIIPTGLDFPSKMEAEAILGTEGGKVDRLLKLKQLAGQKLDIGEDKGCGKTLMGYIHELPADFAPVFILDGSGRLKHSYRLHETYRKNLCRLPSFHHDYSNLTLRRWNKASGKTNLSDPVYRKKLAEAVAGKINEDNENWLVITYKDDGKCDMAQLIRDRIANPGRVRFIHWGIHKATNDYADAKRVMVVSQHIYSDSVYGAIFKAASGRSVSVASNGDLTAVRRSEIQNHILQGVTRSNVRKIGADGKCGEAEVYIIAPTQTVNDDMLKETFPGCSVVTWEPVAKPLTKQEARLVSEIIEQLSDGVSSVTKKAVREAMGVKAPQISRMLKVPAVEQRLNEEGIVCERQIFRRRQHEE